MSKAVIVTAPDSYLKPEHIDKMAIFLAGSIDNGIAPDWQKKVLEALGEHNIMLMNPRRKDWSQNAGPEEVQKQVKWELEALEYADLILMYIAKGSKAPISLLELGLHAKEERLVLAVDPAYYRRVNVEVVCGKYNIPLYETLEELIKHVKSNINDYNR